MDALLISIVLVVKYKNKKHIWNKQNWDQWRNAWNNLKEKIFEEDK